MNILSDIKKGFANNPLITVYRIIVWPLVWSVFLISAAMCGLSSAMFNLSLRAGIDAFMEVIKL